MSRRIQAAIIGSLAALALPGVASAKISPFCGQTCTGGVPKISNSNSGALQHAEIIPIFWGTYWNGNVDPGRGKWVGYLQAMVNSAYFAPLSQYGMNGNGIAPPRLAPIAPIVTVDPVPSGDYTVAELGDEINRLIARGTVPPPTANTDPIYVVFLQSRGGSDWNQIYLNTDGTPYHLALINGYDGVDSAGLGHEIVEAITSNITTPNCTGDQQIADLCECEADNEWQQNGKLRLASYWSAYDGGCVIPEGYQSVYQYNGSGQSWTQIADTVRQIYGGSDGLYITDTTDTPYQYVGVPFWFSSLGLPNSQNVSMLAVGNNDVLALSLDTSAVYRYSGSGWTQIDNAAGAIFAGPFDMDTDYDGNGYQWVSSSGWIEFAGPSSQFIMSDQSVAALSLDHSDVKVYYGGNPHSPSWWNTQHGASELYAGPGDAYGARNLDSARDMSVMQALGSWNALNQTSNNIAFFSTSTKTEVARETNNRQAVYLDTAGLESSPSWTQIRGPAIRLVGAGNALYAAVGVTYAN